MSDNDRPVSYRDIRPEDDQITLEQVGDALRYFAEIAHKYAVAYAEVRFQAEMLKKQEAVGALMSDETSNDRRLWDARTQPAWQKRAERLRDATITATEIETRMKGAELIARLWQTQCADGREPGNRR